MYKVIHGKTHELTDVDKFIEIVNTLDKQPPSQARSLFNPERKIFVSRAPGRLDIMGGIADYSGSLVLQLPIKEAIFAAVQVTADRTIRIVSLCNKNSDRQNNFEMCLDDFFINQAVIDYKTASKYFQKNKKTKWAAYVAGVFLVLIREMGVDFDQGASILVYSDIPEGKGVSSSAALEVAAMSAITQAYGISLIPDEMARLCLKVENLVVGAPCGIMDQMTVTFAKANQLLALLCQPAELQPFIPISEEISFWGIDSGIKHDISGTDYTSVRIGAFMGQRIIKELIGELALNDIPGIQSKYLANITPGWYDRHFFAHIPQQMKGSAFLEKYESTIDEVTEIDPHFNYNIAKPTRHPIYEHSRVKTFAELLKTNLTEENCIKLGELMYQSHLSYSDCGLGSTGTDRLVQYCRVFGPEKGVYGAKITGGGSGGTIAILGKHDAGDIIEELTTKYKNEMNYEPYVFSGSSMGMAAFDHLILKDS